MELFYESLIFPVSSRHCCCVSVLFYCFYYVTRGIPASRNLSQGKCPLRPFSVSPVIAPTVSLVYLCPALLNNCPAPPSLTLASGGVPGGGVDESHPQDSIKISEVIRVERGVDFPTPNLASICCLGPILSLATPPAHLSQVIPDENTDKEKAPAYWSRRP